MDQSMTTAILILQKLISRALLPSLSVTTRWEEAQEARRGRRENRPLLNQECWLKAPLVQKVRLVILGRLVHRVPLVLLVTPVKGDPQEEEDFQVLMVHPDLQAL